MTHQRKHWNKAKNKSVEIKRSRIKPEIKPMCQQVAQSKSFFFPFLAMESRTQRNARFSRRRDALKMGGKGSSVSQLWLDCISLHYSWPLSAASIRLWLLTLHSTHPFTGALTQKPTARQKAGTLVPAMNTLFMQFDWFTNVEATECDSDCANCDLWRFMWKLKEDLVPNQQDAFCSSALSLYQRNIKVLQTDEKNIRLCVTWNISLHCVSRPLKKGIPAPNIWDSKANISFSL